MTVAARVSADRMMIEPARFVAESLSRTGQPAWEYRFSYVAESMRKTWSGAPHASEIPFVFDTVRARYGSALTPADEKMAQTANSFWIQFAKTGNPNRLGLPKWPKYSSRRDELMNFTDDGPAAQADPWKERLDLTQRTQNTQ
jgi:para-nitrobenzyl esterase